MYHSNNIGRFYIHIQRILTEISAVHTLEKRELVESQMGVDIFETSAFSQETHRQSAPLRRRTTNNDTLSVY